MSQDSESNPTPNRTRKGSPTAMVTLGYAGFLALPWLLLGGAMKLPRRKLRPRLRKKKRRL